jgi:hypothetical protein
MHVELSYSTVISNDHRNILGVTKGTEESPYFVKISLTDICFFINCSPLLQYGFEACNQQFLTILIFVYSFNNHLDIYSSLIQCKVLTCCLLERRNRTGNSSVRIENLVNVKENSPYS